MPIYPYVRGGAHCRPEILSAAEAAFDKAVADLGISPEEGARRETVARFILEYVRTNEAADAAKIREATVRALGWFAKRSGAGLPA